MEYFWVCFVPFFVAVDPIGLLPIFLGIVEGLDKKRVNKIIVQSILTAMVVALLFLFVGEAILRLLGITVSDFLIAGGIILFMISVNDLFTEDKSLRRIEPESLGPVPIGVPLIVGPAVLTTIMLLTREYGFVPTATALIALIVLTGVMLFFSGYITKFLGSSGTKITSKIASLLLAAIAVMMVRRGIFSVLLDG
ncbi:MarC family protein [Chitinispirillales bacterium ANBcel5]|uniref:MarC family protein n=1 Tax=Cellulosispirillum alkaliphilum TaxID=3039283 RepID=UPI002A546EEB|nr:MarC family protein [Chitinispirillales bacterium ANBcel5]